MCVDSHRLIAGPLHGETIVDFDTNRADASQWIELGLDRYVGHRVALEFTPAKDSTLEVYVVLQSATEATRQAWDEQSNRTAEHVRDFATEAYKILGQDSQDWAADWADQRAQLRTQVTRRSRTAIAMFDGSGEDDHILIRGNSSKPGNIEPRHFLTAISGDAPLSISGGSGRHELAEAIVAETNPLTYRVIVNRIWHHLMGRGIVPTTDDFGVLGQSPTHPELLDHLATTFISDGKSIKRSIRRIVLSSAYAMSSMPNPQALATDPTNQLWHHRPPRRLEGEAIRDSLLMISGRMNQSMFGSSVPVHLTDFMDGRGRPSTSGPRDGDGRRSIYTAVRRNFLPSFMLAFDTPTPSSTMGRRNVSNVPAQALILMNDPLVVELTAEWANRVISTDRSTSDRITAMYRAAFARVPTQSEQSVASEFIGDHPDASQRWADLCMRWSTQKSSSF